MKLSFNMISFLPKITGVFTTINILMMRNYLVIIMRFAPYLIH
jgi:hypothetical protein